MHIHKVLRVSCAGLLILGVLCSCLLCGCDRRAEEEQTAGYTLTVKTEGGMPLSDIRVYVYKDDSAESLLWASETEADGNISFVAALSDEYVAVLENVPEGFACESMYPVYQGNTDIVLKTVVVDGDISTAQYEIGNVIRDFTVTAANGREYRISELLKEKKAVVLNFWYMGCVPCKMEFPYMEEAYGKFKDDIEIIAMNPVDGTEDSIMQFAKDNELTFPMAKCDFAWEGAFSLNAYPTTVVIDRYGVICMKHSGGIPDSATFEKIFAHFTADDYKQSLIRNISDIEQ